MPPFSNAYPAKYNLVRVVLEYADAGTSLHLKTQDPKEFHVSFIYLLYYKLSWKTLNE